MTRAVDWQMCVVEACVVAWRVLFLEQEETVSQAIMGDCNNRTYEHKAWQLIAQSETMKNREE